MTKLRGSRSATTGSIDASSVGIRELRDHLSSYMERVKAGETLTITEHGRPIARIVGSALSPRLVELVARGEATLPTRPWSEVRKVRGVPYEGNVQDLIDEVRG